jgi:hypothetical protein
MRFAVPISLAILTLAPPPAGGTPSGEKPAGKAVRTAGGLPPLDFEEGQPFPDIVLPSADGGRPMSVSDFRGEKVVLHVFASW